METQQSSPREGLQLDCVLQACVQGDRKTEADVGFEG